ncbi:two-component response regulator ORR22-like [Daucus carota subsp. sativus]|uniref:two-component response regulator ORR22-like n=1 Tax=Daucus carota subsp. sativus TaxID=79200 RepID=UPI003083A7F1
MTMNTVSTPFVKDISFVQCVHILLVVHNVSLLMSLESRFKEQEYQVTTEESACSALARLKKRKSCHNIVIADIDMPEMEIFEFVRKVRHECTSIPVILIAGDVTMEFVSEAFNNGVCYLFSKSPSNIDIRNTWQHVYRETGKLPALTDNTSPIDEEKYFNQSNDINRCDSAIKPNPGNSKRKMIITVEENKTIEDDVGNHKKSRMTLSTSLHSKFLDASNILCKQEAGAGLNSILGRMKESGTYSQLSGKLQGYGGPIKVGTNSQVIAPAFISKPPIRLNASHFVCYKMEEVKRKLEAMSYNVHNTIKENIKDDQAAHVGKQSPLFPHDFAHMTMKGGQDTRNCFQAKIVEPVGVQADDGNGGKTSEGTDQNYISKEHTLLGPHNFSDGIMQASGQLNTGVRDLNQEPTSDLGMGIVGSKSVGNQESVNHVNFEEGTSVQGMLGFKNVGKPTSANHVNFGEGTSDAHHKFSEVFEDDGL